MPLFGVSVLGSGREWVTLEAYSDLLVGHSSTTAIRSIAVLAPGVSRGHVILRDQQMGDGDRIIHISGPPALATRAVRVTVFLRPGHAGVGVLEHREGRWHARQPQVLTVEGDDQSSCCDAVIGVVLEGLNPVRLTQPGATANPSSSRPSQSRWSVGLPAGDVQRGILPSFFAALLLAVGLRLSSWAHRTAAHQQDRTAR